MSIIIYHFSYWKSEQDEGGSDTESSDGERFHGTAVSDSDDEPGADGLMSRLINSQERMAAGMSRLAEEVKNQKIVAAPLVVHAGGENVRAAESGGEPTAAQLDQFIAKLSEHEKIVDNSAAEGRVGGGGITLPAIGGSGGGAGGGAEGPKGRVDVTARVASLAEGRNPREALLQALKQHRTVDNMKVGGVKSRVAPVVLSRLLKGGRTAKQEVKEGLRAKELECAPVASEIAVLGMILDRMLMTGQHDMLINS